jgi:hypothetical protein
LVGQARIRALEHQRAELQTAADTHSSLAFRALKRMPPPPLEQVQHNGVTTTFPGHVVLHYGTVWAGWWKASDAPPAEQAHTAIREHLPQLTPTLLREVAMKFSCKTSAPDGLPPRAMAALSDRCLAALCQSYTLWDRTQWPSSEAAQITVLIPKRDGGLRPIALFRTLYRLFSRAHTHTPGQKLGFLNRLIYHVQQRHWPLGR